MTVSSEVTLTAETLKTVSADRIYQTVIVSISVFLNPLFHPALCLPPGVFYLKMWTVSYSILLLGVFAFCAKAHDGHEHHQPTADSWDNKLDLKKIAGVDFKWNASDPEFVTMEMSSRTKGYIAVGFCPVWKGSMEGCDIVAGWINENDLKPHLVDYHATGNTHPIKDSSQDYELISGKQDENFLTTIAFRRRWSTGDLHDANLETDYVQVIWSWNTEDGSNEGLPAHDKNSRGHTKTMILLKKPSEAALKASQISICSSAGAGRKIGSALLPCIAVLLTFHFPS